MYLLSRRIFNVGRQMVRAHRRAYCDLPDKLTKQHRAKTAISQHKLPRKLDRQQTNADKDKDEDDDDEDDRGGFVPDYDYRFMSEFDVVKQKNRETFLEMIRVYESRDKHRRYNVEFIYAALKQMREFGVEQDVEVYKKLLDVMPKGKYVATNAILVEFVFYPKHQYCIVFLLDQMEYNGEL